MPFMSENAKNYAGLFYRWLIARHGVLCSLFITKTVDLVRMIHFFEQICASLVS